MHDEGSTATLKAVAEFYRKHPYPDPEKDLEGYRRGDMTLAGSPIHFFHLFWPERAPHTDLRILVAGCGTSQAAKYALLCPDAEVIGVDLSSTSLDHTRELIDKYGIRNLELHQLPLEASASLKRDFDLVVSTGVLHHLKDPSAGLKALRDVTRPDGAMFLMVYAPYGRAGVYMFQDYCRLLGIRPTEEGIRELHEVIERLPSDHPLHAFARQADDLKYSAGIADSLLHPQDRAFSVPQLFDWLDQCGLEFGRWFVQAPYEPECSPLHETTHLALLGKMSARDRYAAVELFRGNFVRHEFVAYRVDRPASVQPLIEADDWADCIPLPFPGARENLLGLPPGIAAQLWHPAHKQANILLDVTPDQWSLYQSIDGQRSVAEITNGRTNPEIRDFFAQLWKYDQILLRRQTR